MKKIIPLVAVILIFAACKKNSLATPVTDNSSTSALATDFNEPGKYAFVKIGTQKWMTINLEISHYQNGDHIPQVKSMADWGALTTGAWCWYDNDSATYAATYGKLYNWYAVNDPRGLAPIGWHIPDDAEWDILLTHLGTNAGGKLKETGTTHWLAPNTGATNKSGFTALPGGYRFTSGEFINNGTNGYWWSSTEDNTTNAWCRGLNYDNGTLDRGSNYKRAGMSVRCVKD